MPTLPILLLMTACRPSLELEAEVSESMGTVVTVRWSTPESESSHVEFGYTEALGRRSASSEGTEHEATLLGLRPDEIVHLQVVSESASSVVETITTGPLPGDVPELTLTGDPDALPGYLLVPLIGSAGMAVIIDPEGHIVWQQPLDGRDSAYRMWLDREAGHITFNNFAMDNSGRIDRVSLDGTAHEMLDFTDHNHDFVVMPDGDFAAIATIRKGVEGDIVAGDGIYRADMEGNTEILWSAWDHFEYTGRTENTPDTLGGWTHANAIDHDPEGDAFYLSLRSFDAILKITASTGDIEWILSGDEALSDFTFAEGSAPTSHQHQFEMVSEDRLLSFDNRYDLHEPARVVEYALDFDTMTAEEVWSYSHDPALSVYALGDVSRLDDGSTFIDWSTSGVLQLLSPEGEEVWRLNTELGYAFGYASLLEDIDGSAP